LHGNTPHGFDSLLGSGAVVGGEGKHLVPGSGQVADKLTAKAQHGFSQRTYNGYSHVLVGRLFMLSIGMKGYFLPTSRLARLRVAFPQ